MIVIRSRLDYTQEYVTLHIKGHLVGDTIIFTGNEHVKRDGCLVMGAGCAKQVRDYYKGIDRQFGKMIRHDRAVANEFNEAEPNSVKVRRLMFCAVKLKDNSENYDGRNPCRSIGWLQVKHHWSDDANLELVKEAMLELKAQAKATPYVTFHCNYPAVGNGKLKFDVVNSLLESLELPRNVRLYL